MLSSRSWRVAAAVTRGWLWPTHGDVVDAVEVGAGVRVVEVLAEPAHHLGRRGVVERLRLRDHGAPAREQRAGRAPAAPRARAAAPGSGQSASHGSGERRRRKPGQRRQAGRRDLDVQVSRQRAALRQVPDHGAFRHMVADRHRGREPGQAQRESAGRAVRARPLPRARPARPAVRAPPAFGREDVEAEVDRRGLSGRRSRVAWKRASPCAPIAPTGVSGSSAIGERSVSRARLDARERPRPGGHARRAARRVRARRRAGRPPPRARAAHRPRSRRSPSRPHARAGRSRCAARAAPAAPCRPRRSPRAPRSDAGRLPARRPRAGRRRRSRARSRRRPRWGRPGHGRTHSPRRLRARTRAACA